jgi:hypothetical protein
VFRWVVGSTSVWAGGTPSGGTGPLAAASPGNFIYSESSYAGADATVTLPGMMFTDTALVVSFDYHMHGATMGNLYLEYDAGSGWVTIDSIVGQQQAAQSDPWMTSNSLLATPASAFTLRVRAQRGTSYTGDMAIDNFSVTAQQSCMAPAGLSASNITASSFDVAWVSSSFNSGSPLSYEVRYRSTGGSAYMSNGASATVSGLAAVSSYDVSVREICAVGDTSSWSADLAVTTPLCDASSQCQYIVYMTDSYGDGWNGNTLTFSQSGTVVASSIGSGFTTGSSFTDTIGLCDWDSASVTLSLGAWSEEMGFDVVGSSGDTLLSHSPAASGLANGYSFGSFVPQCTPCAPTNRCQYIVHMTDSYGDGWQGNTLSFSQSGTVMASNIGAGFLLSYAVDTVSLCDLDSATVTLGTLGWWSSEMGFDVTNMNGDTVLTHLSGTTLVLGHNFGSFVPFCGPCAPITSLPYTENFDDTTSWTPSAFPYNSVFDACWTPSPDAVTTSVFRWVVGSTSVWAGGTPSGGTGPLAAASPGNFIYSESSYAGADATVTLPNMAFTDTALVVSFDYHMYGATMGNRYVEYDAGSGWVTFDSIVGQQQAAQSDPWMTRSSLLINPTGTFTLRLRAQRGTSYTGDMAIDNFSVDILQSCNAPSTLSASNITASSFDVAWVSSSLNSGSPLSYEVRYRSTGGSAYTSNGASATVSGLTAASSYDVSVREICAVGDTSGWSADLAVTTALCNAADQCGFIVYMTDSYGDGWQSNELTFSQSGIAVASNVGAGFLVGSSFTDTVMLCTLDSASVTLGNLGDWSDEVGFNVTNMSGDTLLTHTSGTTLTAGQALGTFYPECRTPATYTVSVNMAKESVHPAGVHIAGNFQGWNPSATLMTDPDGDGIYEYTINTYLDENIEYKFINGGAWGSDESVPTDCRYNGSWNRGDSITSLADTAAVVCFAACTDCQINVTFQVNMAWELANGSISGDSIHVAGSMQGWAPAGTVMLDTAGDGIYQVTLAAAINSKIWYKYLNGKTWNDAEASGDLSACGEDDGFGGNNRVDSLGVTDTVLGVVCFTKCYDCSVGLPEAITGVTLYPNPTRGEFTLERTELEGDIEVTVVDMQGQLLRATLWTTGQADLDMDLSDMASGVYMIRLNTEEGNRTMRVAIQR